MNRLDSLDELLAGTAHLFRVFAVEQFRSSDSLRRQLKRLVSAGALLSAVQSVVLVKHVECVHIHVAGDDRMDWDELARDLRSRWAEHQPSPATLYWASPRTVNLLGGCMPGRLSHLDAVTHDLGVTALILHLFETDPCLRDAWVGEEHFEDIYAQAKLDGALADVHGPRCLIEFAGKYSAERLSRLAALADRLSVPLQFWSIARLPR